MGPEQLRPIADDRGASRSDPVYARPHRMSSTARAERGDERDPELPSKVVDGMATARWSTGRRSRPGEERRTPPATTGSYPVFLRDRSWRSAVKIELSRISCSGSSSRWTCGGTPLGVSPVRSVHYHPPGSVPGEVQGRRRPCPHLGKRWLPIAVPRGPRRTRLRCLGDGRQHLSDPANTWLIPESDRALSLIARQTLPASGPRPMERRRGYAEDHLHLDLGTYCWFPAMRASRRARHEDSTAKLKEAIGRRRITHERKKGPENKSSTSERSRSRPSAWKPSSPSSSTASR